MSNLSRKTGRFVAITATGFVVFGSMCLPANASPESPEKNAFGQCLVEPAQLVHHKALTRAEQRWVREVPGEVTHVSVDTQYTRVIDAVAATTYDAWKFFQIVPGDSEESHTESQFWRENPGQSRETVDQQKYRRTVKGLEEVTHKLYQFTQEVPGVEAVTHKEWQHSRIIPAEEAVTHSEQRFHKVVPGSAEESHKEYQFSKVIPGSTEESHKEYTYQKSETQYRFRNRVARPDNTLERKFIKGYDFVSGGTTRVNGNTVAGHWVQSAGWHAIPDSIINVIWGSGGVPSNLLGGSEAHPKGNVSLSTYGGPGVSVPYYASLITISGGYTDWGPWSDWTTTNPGGDTNTRSVESKNVTVLYKDGAWTTDTPGGSWQKSGERTVVDKAATPDQTVYRGADGSAVNDKQDAGWFRQASFNGWTQSAHKKVVDKEAVSDKEVFLGANNAEVTDAKDAVWLPTSSVDGWEQYGAARTVTDKEAIPAKKVFRAEDGSDVDNIADAGWSPDRVIAGWDIEGGSRTVTDAAAIPAKDVYLGQDGQPVDSPDDAGWFDQSTFDGWTQYGEPQTVVDQAATPDTEEFLTRDERGILGTSANEADASVFTANEVVDPSWTAFDQETVEFQAYVAPFIEWLTQDRTVTTDKAEAGWFAEGFVLDNWQASDTTRTVIDRASTEDVTWYLTRDEQGVVTRTIDPLEAAEFTDEDVVDTTGWTLFGLHTVTNDDAVPAATQWLTRDEHGTFGVTEDPAAASWISSDLDIPVDTPLWEPAVDEDGKQLIRVIAVDPIAGHLEYYVPGGKTPSLDLGDANWTTDTPKGWTFVDKRDVTVKKAWDEKIPARYDECELPKTGTDDTVLTAALAAVTFGGIGGTMLFMSRRGKHMDQTRTVKTK